MNQFGYIFLIFIFYIFHLFAIFSSQLLQIHPISLPKTSQALLSCMGAMNKQRYANPTTRSVLECYFGVTPGNLDISLLDSGKKSGLIRIILKLNAHGLHHSIFTLFAMNLKNCICSLLFVKLQ